MPIERQKKPYPPKRIITLKALYEEKTLNLKTLNLANYAIFPEDIDKLLHFLIDNNVNSLNVAGSNINDEGIKRLANITTLTTLDISRNDISPDAIMSLADKASLKSVRISYNYNLVGFYEVIALATNKTLDL